MFYKVQIISFLSVAGRSFGSVHFHGVSKMYHCHKSSCLLQLQISHLVMFHVKTYYQTRWKTLPMDLWRWNGSDSIGKFVVFSNIDYMRIVLGV